MNARAKIRDLCVDAGMPLEDIARVLVAVKDFASDDLKLRAGRALIAAWRRDHEPLR